MLAFNCTRCLTVLPFLVLLFAVAPVRAAAPPAAVAIIPHQAVYGLRLVATHQGSTLSGLGGRIFFSWQDDCQAWNVTQKTQLHFYYHDGEASDSTISLVSREDKDGNTYLFHVTRRGDKGGNKAGDAAAPTILHGSATLTRDASGMGHGLAHDADGGAEVTLPAPTLFPVQHTLALLRHAHEGQPFFVVNVFDGADEGGLSEISAFIGKAGDGRQGAAATVAENPLLKTTAWPIRLAFFDPKNQSGVPDYEMDMVLLDNGIIKSMKMDYGSFAMIADLVEVKALPPSHCPL